MMKKRPFTTKKLADLGDEMNCWICPDGTILAVDVGCHSHQLPKQYHSERMAEMYCVKASDNIWMGFNLLPPGNLRITRQQAKVLIGWHEDFGLWSGHIERMGYSIEEIRDLT